MTLSSVPLTTLGASGLPVSRLALGSWRTFERISRDQGVRVMRAAREAGISFLDDARYDDETGNAPLPTGYSEVVFGELFRAAGSLERMRFDHIDLIYSAVPPDGVSLEDVIEMITGLIRAGTARAWGTLAERLTPDERERLAAIGVS